MPSGLRSDMRCFNKRIIVKLLYVCLFVYLFLQDFFFEKFREYNIGVDFGKDS